MHGFIKLHRKFKDWEWYSKPNMVLFFIHCLLKANHKKNLWKGIDLMPGQFISGRKVLSDETGISEQGIRTCIKYLKSTKELTTTPTKGVDGKYTVYTLNSWEKYQVLDEATSVSTKGQPRVNQGSTTNKNDKNDKNDIYREFDHLKITTEDFDMIKEKYSIAGSVVDSIIDDIQNYKKNKNYKSLSLTVQSWIRKRNKDNPIKPMAKQLPTYRSGAMHV